MADGRGGWRPGAGRKPKRRIERAEALVEAELRIAERLPDLIDRLIALAEADPPHVGALKYLVDRVMGRPVNLNEIPPAMGMTDDELDAACKALGVPLPEPAADTAPD